MVKSKKTIMIIGLGGQGHSWMHNIKKHPDYDLIGFVDTDMEMLSHAKDMGFPEENAYPSIEDACKYGEKPDVVVIATPINTHHSIARECMELGINTICEKNMASTIPMGKQMVQMAMDHPELCTALGTQYRFESQNWTAKCYLQGPDNQIGKLGSISWQSIGYRGDKRWGWKRFLQEVYTEDMSVHYFDLLRYTTGMDIVQIKADTFMPCYSGWHGSSSIFATLALAKKEEWYNRHNWVWVTFVGDWQRRGPTHEDFEFFGATGQMKMNGPFGLALKLYKNTDDWTKFEEEWLFKCSKR